jgi:uncharacterized protein
MTIIDNHIDSVKILCAKYKVEKIYLFGSALNSNFNERLFHFTNKN